MATTSATLSVTRPRSGRRERTEIRANFPRDVLASHTRTQTVNANAIPGQRFRPYAAPPRDLSCRGSQETDRVDAPYGIMRSVEGSSLGGFLLRLGGCSGKHMARRPQASARHKYRSVYS